MSNLTVSFIYKNHRGKTEQRTVDVDGVEFIHQPGFGYQPGWFISGYCHTKKARRSFALCNIDLRQLNVEGSGVSAAYRLPFAEKRIVPLED